MKIILLCGAGSLIGGICLVGYHCTISEIASSSATLLIWGAVLIALGLLFTVLWAIDIAVERLSARIDAAFQRGGIHKRT